MLGGYHDYIWLGARSQVMRMEVQGESMVLSLTHGVADFPNRQLRVLILPSDIGLDMPFKRVQGSGHIPGRTRSQDDD
jgi:hypothetical protein